ncbi:MAG: hypothetical protein LBN34_09940, partial [Clostridiales Family XIII bacterium]|nr:hypothetical protein [Clostridiales Family XIII bacterium]
MIKINSGTPSSLASPIIAAEINATSGHALVVVPTEAVCSEIALNLRFFLVGSAEVIELDEEDFSFVRFDATSHESVAKRLRVLTALVGRLPRSARNDSSSTALVGDGGDHPVSFADTPPREGNIVVVAPLSAVLTELDSPDHFRNSILKISLGEHLDLEKLKGLLFASGYVRTPYAEVPGEYAMRGGIIDIFPYQSEVPFRIELFDDLVESIQCYSPLTQTRLPGPSLEEFMIAPYIENGQHEKGQYNESGGLGGRMSP